ncbi:MAG TPA: hypothetical protein VFK79_04960 [Xanthobacteraceae bacterium]|nr:hypothetical protein [Xanthobacteraceae bacterium]
MRRACPRPAIAVSIAVIVAAFAAGCATAPPPAPAQPPPPAIEPSLPPSFQPTELIGRWGLAAYHRPDDRARTEAAARNQCKQPYIIGAGPSGGLILHLADQKEPQELQLKGSRSGKNYIGPRDDPPGGAQDREVVSFDGRVLITRWMDPEIAGRYGNAVYVRCAPRA